MDRKGERRVAGESPVHRKGTHHGWPRRRLRADGRWSAGRQTFPAGGPGSGTNPEQLFAVGWSACFLSAIKLVAGKKKIALPDDAAINVEVDLGTTGNGYVLAARLNVSLPGVAPDVAQTLADAAHQICPYSNATRGNIDATIAVV